MILGMDAVIESMAEWTLTTASQLPTPITQFVFYLSTPCNQHVRVVRTASETMRNRLAS
jgi:hypothetical protein